jgi:hypothetical protein
MPRYAFQITLEFPAAWRPCFERKLLSTPRSAPCRHLNLQTSFAHGLLVAHIYVWCKSNAPRAVAGIAEDTQYRESLAKHSPDFRLLRDIAKVQKHVHLTRGNPEGDNRGAGDYPLFGLTMRHGAKPHGIVRLMSW